MKLLVTGGAGYLGSLLTPELLEQGHQVRILDSFMWGANPILHFAAHPSLEVVAGDIRDERVVTDAVRGCDVVINLAAIVGFPACLEDPERARTTNEGGVRTLVSTLSKHQRLIHASTGSTYGKVNHICDEDTPINPLTVYGTTKASAEKFVLDHGGVPLRFATVFGRSPRLRLDLLVNDMTYQAVHYGTFVMYEGHARRTFLHSTDAVKAIVFAIENYGRMSAQPFNVGDETMNYTKMEVAKEIQAVHNFYLHEASVGVDPDQRDYEVSYKRIKALGYKADVSLSAGIRELVKILPLIRERSAFRNV
jgi:nucleoside-diphosphate-sugar epimerase